MKIVPSQPPERQKEECIQIYSNLKKGNAMKITIDIKNIALETYRKALISTDSQKFKKKKKSKQARELLLPPGGF